MFVQNLTGEALIYKNNSILIEIPPLRVKYIDDLIASAETLKKEFGEKAVTYVLGAEGQPEVEEITKIVKEITGKANIVKRNEK